MKRTLALIATIFISLTLAGCVPGLFDPPEDGGAFECPENYTCTEPGENPTKPGDDPTETNEFFNKYNEATVVVEVGRKFDLIDYIKTNETVIALEDYRFESDLINPQDYEVGEYETVLEVYYDDDMFEVIINLVFKIDLTTPVIEETDLTHSFFKGQDVDLLKYIEVTDNHSAPEDISVKVSVEDTTWLAEGTIRIKYTATDEEGNETEHSIKFEVIGDPGILVTNELYTIIKGTDMELMKTIFSDNVNIINASGNDGLTVEYFYNEELVGIEPSLEKLTYKLYYNGVVLDEKEIQVKTQMLDNYIEERMTLIKTLQVLAETGGIQMTESGIGSRYSSTRSSDTTIINGVKQIVESKNTSEYINSDIDESYSETSSTKTLIQNKGTNQCLKTDSSGDEYTYECSESDILTLESNLLDYIMRFLTKGDSVTLDKTMIESLEFELTEDSINNPQSSKINYNLYFTIDLDVRGSTMTGNIVISNNTLDGEEFVEITGDFASETKRIISDGTIISTKTVYTLFGSNNEQVID